MRADTKLAQLDNLLLIADGKEASPVSERRGYLPSDFTYTLASEHRLYTDDKGVKRIGQPYVFVILELKKSKHTILDHIQTSYSYHIPMNWEEDDFHIKSLDELIEDAQSNSQLRSKEEALEYLEKGRQMLAVMASPTS